MVVRRPVKATVGGSSPPLAEIWRQEEQINDLSPPDLNMREEDEDGMFKRI